MVREGYSYADAGVRQFIEHFSSLRLQMMKTTDAICSFELDPEDIKMCLQLS